MRQRFITTLAITAAFSATATMAEAQRSSGGAATTGSAVSRGGDSGGSGSGGGAPSGGSSGSSSSGSSSGGSSTPGMSPGSSFGGSSPTPAAWSSFEAPRRSNGQAQGRSRGSGTSSTGSAVSRDGGSAPRSGGGSAAPTGDRSSASSGGDQAPTRRAVPEYSRPRDGRPVTGTAVSRGSVPPPSGGGGNIIYYPYNPWGFYGPGYGYGLGYLFYDPWYGGGYGYGDPFGGYGYGGYGYGGGGGGGYAISKGYQDSGSLRLKIDPRQAQVYVDGYFVGVVDSFDGAFQKLGLEGGGHKIELKADGFEPLDFEVLITPGETVTYKGEMKRIQ